MQHGHFSAGLLATWKSCERLYLVDIWRAQQNYKDMANVDNAQQEAILAEARKVSGLTPLAMTSCMHMM